GRGRAGWRRCRARQRAAALAGARASACVARRAPRTGPVRRRADPARGREPRGEPVTGRLRVAIVDDEPPARALLRDYLRQHPDVDVVAECTDGFDAVKALESVQADLVLLDVQMPKLDGFEVLELLEPGPLVVFVTAFDEFALRAFEVNAVDYLLKPLGP